MIVPLRFWTTCTFIFFIGFVIFCKSYVTHLLFSRCCCFVVIEIERMTDYNHMIDHSLSIHDKIDYGLKILIITWKMITAVINHYVTSASFCCLNWIVCWLGKAKFWLILFCRFYVGSTCSFVFFIPATTANDLGLRRISIPDLIHYIIFLS